MGWRDRAIRDDGTPAGSADPVKGSWRDRALREDGTSAAGPFKRTIKTDGTHQTDTDVVENHSDPHEVDNMVRSALDGVTGGFADKAAAAIGTAVPWLNRTPEDIIAGKPYEKKTYAQNRDELAPVYAKAVEEHPVANIVGATAMPLPGASTVKGMMGVGALAGGINALGHSKADLTKGEYGQAALDTGLGAGAGAATAGVLGYAGTKLGGILKKFGGERALKAVGAIQKDLKKIPAADQEALANELLDQGVIGWADKAENIGEKAKVVRDAVGKDLGKLYEGLDAAVAEKPVTDAASAAQKPSLEDIMARVKAQQDRVKQLVAEGEKPLTLAGKDGGQIVVSRDASKPGRWRATRIDAAGEPIGHTEAPDFEGAVKTAKDLGADLFAGSRGAESKGFDMTKAVRRIDNQVVTPLADHPESLKYIPTMEEKLNDLLTTTGDKTSFAKANALKTGYDSHINYNRKAQKMDVADLIKDLRNALRDEIGDQAAQVSPAKAQELKALNNTYGKMSTAMELAENGANREHGNNLFGSIGKAALVGTGAAGLVGGGGEVGGHGHVRSGAEGLGAGTIAAVLTTIASGRGDAFAARAATMASRFLQNPATAKFLNEAARRGPNAFLASLHALQNQPPETAE